MEVTILGFGSIGGDVIKEYIIGQTKQWPVEIKDNLSFVVGTRAYDERFIHVTGIAEGETELVQQLSQLLQEIRGENGLFVVTQSVSFHFKPPVIGPSKPK